ncbi:hypothetical protein CEXT_252261 [Caerostris extrusa]|uniref:Uncharacterized protein n=1 Tax=Caerostris extrusa TaxID=172846 RepID=A0AAV4W131_CAEEX|nr:hypothetical protein CEXT_252261 [Caerostris extrusa]
MALLVPVKRPRWVGGVPCTILTDCQYGAEIPLLTLRDEFPARSSYCLISKGVLGLGTSGSLHGQVPDLVAINAPRLLRRFFGWDTPCTVFPLRISNSASLYPQLVDE